MKCTWYVAVCCWIFLISCGQEGMSGLLDAHQYRLLDQDPAFELTVAPASSGVFDLELNRKQEEQVYVYFAQLFPESPFETIGSLKGHLVKDEISGRVIITLMAYGAHVDEAGHRRLLPMAVEFKSPMITEEKFADRFIRRSLSRSVKHTCDRTSCNYCDFLTLGDRAFADRWIIEKTNFIIGCSCDPAGDREPPCPGNVCNHSFGTAGRPPIGTY